MLSGGGRTSTQAQGKGVMSKLIDYMYAHGQSHYPGMSVITVAARSPLWETLVEEGMWVVLQKWVCYLLELKLLFKTNAVVYYVNNGT